MALDEPKDSDSTDEFDGITYLIDQDLSDKVGKVNVDFVEKGWRSGFVISSEKPLGFSMSSCGGGCAC